MVTRTRLSVTFYIHCLFSSDYFTPFRLRRLRRVQVTSCVQGRMSEHLTEKQDWRSCNVMHRLYQVVFYLRNFLLFHSALGNVTSYAPPPPKKGDGIFAPIFTQLANAWQHYVQHSCKELRPNRVINVENRGRGTSFMTLNKVQIWRRRFCRNSQLIGDIMWKYPIPNFIQIEGNRRHEFAQSRPIWFRKKKKKTPNVNIT